MLMIDSVRTRIIIFALIALALAAFLALSPISPAFNTNTQFGVLAQPRITPEFTHTAPAEWLNSQPLKLSDLRGKVVLLDFWTFDCWNCYRSIPWQHHVEEKLGPNGLRLIGVHSPEFDHERDVNNVMDKIEEFKITHPVMIDNDFSYWKAMKNRYWPSYYVLDKSGRTRGIFAGEVHVGDRRAQAMESLINKLLAES